MEKLVKTARFLLAQKSFAFWFAVCLIIWLLVYFDTRKMGDASTYVNLFIPLCIAVGLTVAFNLVLFCARAWYARKMLILLTPEAQQHLWLLGRQEPAPLSVDTQKPEVIELLDKRILMNVNSHEAEKRCRHVIPTELGCLMIRILNAYALSHRVSRGGGNK